MNAKSTEWRPGPTVCRCCLTEGCYKDISTEYFWMGKREVYSEMLLDTFNVTIAFSQSGGPNSNSRLICEPCISRLRDANDFKRQVLECEKTFMQHLDPGSSTVTDLDLEVQAETLDDVKLERIKLEKRLSEDDFDDREFYDDDDDDDMDDEPLTKLASRIPKKETVDLMDLLDNTKAAEKRKSTTKIKASPSKKSKIVKKETVKASASKVIPKTEKKKKEVDPHLLAKRNGAIVLQYSTAYPFRFRGKAFLCVYCCEGYENPIHLRRHIDCNHKKFSVSTAFAHTGTGKDYLKVDCTNLKCRLCSDPFPNLEEVAKHLIEKHESKDTRQLRLDYDIGLQPYLLVKDKWICFLCDNKFPTITKLCRHMASHYQEYTCDVCGRSYITNEALKYHMRCSHSGEFVCRKCWQNFPTAQAKKEHLSVSKSCWGFACIYCGLRFQSWELKQKHLVDKHNCPQASYPCPECDTTFLTRKHFFHHYKITHTDDGFMCSECGLQFASKKELDHHIITHTGEKQFECTVCSKKFRRKKSLSQHMWIHSETKRFICMLCDKQFAQKSSLKNHLKTYHPDVSLDF